MMDAKEKNWLFSIFPNEGFVDLDSTRYGWEQCEPLHSYGPHARNHYLFHYVISGTGEAPVYRIRRGSRRNIRSAAGRDF